MAYLVDSHSHNSGNRLEFDCINLLDSMGVSYDIKPRVFTGQTTNRGNLKYFEPDIVTDTSVIELKNAVGTGAPEKLPQTVLKLSWLYEALLKIPYLVYQGEVYEDYIENDVIMKQVMALCPHVKVISFENFCSLYE